MFLDSLRTVFYTIYSANKATEINKSRNIWKKEDYKEHLLVSLKIQQ